MWCITMFAKYFNSCQGQWLCLCMNTIFITHYPKLPYDCSIKVFNKACTMMCVLLECWVCVLYRSWQIWENLPIFHLYYLIHLSCHIFNHQSLGLQVFANILPCCIIALYRYINLKPKLVTIIVVGTNSFTMVGSREEIKREVSMRCNWR